MTNRKRLPSERTGITHKFSVGGHKGYLTVNNFEDGSPGELFILISKEGSTLRGFCDAFATMVSIALQHGVKLTDLVDKFTHTKFEPSGWTPNENIPSADSIIDYVFRFLETKYLKQ